MNRILPGHHTRFAPGRVFFPVLVALAVALPALGADPAPPSLLDCVLEPYEVVEVSSAVQGVINEIHVERNDMVQKGQLLVELDSEVERTQVELAKARAALQTNIELRETELAFNVRNEQRLEKLYKTNTISLNIKDQAETDTEKARLQLRNAMDSKRLAELELAKAEAVLALRSMRSPISGVVVARNKVAGEFVEDQSILRLAQLDPLKVEVIAPVELFGSITEGMRVEVVPEQAGRSAQFAIVTMVDRMIDPASGTFDVRAELPNPDLAIPSGLRCTAQFLKGPNPAEAIAAAPTEEPEAVTSSAPEIVAELPKEEPTAVIEPQPEIVVEPDLEAIAATNPEEQPVVAQAVVDAHPMNTESATSTEAFCKTLARSVTRGYKVIADPTRNFSSTEELVRKLQDSGLNDLYVVKKGADRGQVSLGFYSVLDNAKVRRAEITDQGFDVSLVTVSREVKNPDCEAQLAVAN